MEEVGKGEEAWPLSSTGSTIGNYTMNAITPLAARQLPI